MEILKNCPVCGSGKFDQFLTTRDYFLTGESFCIVKCSDCGFRFTNPRPLTGELGKYYQSSDYISHSDSSKGIFASVYQRVRKYTLDRKIKLIEKYQPKGTLLDIGCATGHFLSFIAMHGWEVTGIEPDEKTRIYASAKNGIDVYPEEQLERFQDSTFDIITMWHVLEHVAELNLRMQQLQKLLKPKGTIFIALPNCESHDAKLYNNFWAGYDLPRHLYHFAKKDVISLSEKYGFKVEDILPMKFDAFYVSLLSEKYKHGKMRWIPAFWNGFCSNMKARSKNGFSSQIYVLKLK